MTTEAPPPKDNPFERYDIDPQRGPEAITERLRELAEASRDETERREVRAAWEELTRHPARRYSAALGAHPSRTSAGQAPQKPRSGKPSAEPLGELDVLLRPSVVAALGGVEPHAPLPDVAVEDDPFLR